MKRKRKQVVKLVDGRFAISLGKKWFAYSYDTREIAQAVANKLIANDSNFSFDSPVSQSYITLEEVFL